MDLTPEFALLGSTINFLGCRLSTGALSDIQPNDPELKSCIGVLHKTMKKILNGLEKDLTASERELVEFKIACYFVLIIVRQHYISSENNVDCDPLTGTLPDMSKSFLFSAVQDLDFFKAMILLPHSLQQKITSDLCEYWSVVCDNPEDFMQFIKLFQRFVNSEIHICTIMLHKLIAILEANSKQWNTSKQGDILLNLMEVFLSMVDPKLKSKLPSYLSVYSKKAKLSFDWVLSNHTIRDDSQMKNVSDEAFITFCEKLCESIMRLPTSWFTVLTGMIDQFEDFGNMESNSVRKSMQYMEIMKNFIEFVRASPELQNENAKILEQLITKHDSMFVNPSAALDEDQLKVHIQIVNERLPNHKEHFIHLLNLRDFDKKLEPMWLNCIRSNVDILNDSASILILIQLYEYLHNTQSIHEKDILRILEKSFKMLPEIEVNKIFKNMSEFDQFPSDVKLYDLTSSIFNRLTEGTRKNEVFPEFAWLCLNYPSLMVDRAVMFAVKHSGQTKPISMLLHAVYNVCTMSTESSTLLESTLIKHIDSSFLSEKECENAKMLIKLLMSPQENSSSRGNLLIPLFLMKHFVNHPVGDLNSKILFGIDMFYFIAELNFDYKFESVDLFPFLIRLAFKLNQCLQILTNNKNSVLSYKQKCMKAIEITINLLLKKGDSKSTCYHAWLESYLIQIDWTIHLYIDSKLNGHSYSGVRLDILSFVKACAICDVLTVDNLESKTVPYNELVACLVKVLPYCLLTEWRNIMRIVGELYKHERILLERNDNSGCPMNLSQILYDVLYVSSATQEGTVLVHMVQCYCIITKEFISTQITYGDILYLFIQAIELMKILPESTAESVGVMTIDFLLIIEKQTMAAEQLKRIDEYLCNLKDERFSIILKKWTNICQSLSQSVSN